MRPEIASRPGCLSMQREPRQFTLIAIFAHNRVDRKGSEEGEVVGSWRRASACSLSLSLSLIKKMKERERGGKKRNVNQTPRIASIQLLASWSDLARNRFFGTKNRWMNLRRSECLVFDRILRQRIPANQSPPCILKFCNLTRFRKRLVILFSMESWRVFLSPFLLY